MHNETYDQITFNIEISTFKLYLDDDDDYDDDDQVAMNFNKQYFVHLKASHVVIYKFKHCVQNTQLLKP